MKSELQAKYLRYLLEKKRKDEGFTLIELLVVIIIIGILAAIALPTFLNQANRARESEAKTYVGTMNRGQQAYYLDEQEFSSTITELGLGLDTETENYSYAINGGGEDSTNATNQAQPEGETAAFRAYIGGVNVGVVEAGGEATTYATLCEALNPELVDGAANGTEVATFNEAAPPDCPDTYDAIN
ncbi:MAG: type IV pilin-like G/H family protein [Elainellaceae cyanobacterium]